MPDISFALGPEDEPEIQFWTTELCMSCKRQGATTCPVAVMMLQLRLQTFSGCHIFSCGMYDPDQSSEFYTLMEGRPEYPTFKADKEAVAIHEDIMWRLGVDSSHKDGSPAKDKENDNRDPP